MQVTLVDVADTMAEHYDKFKEAQERVNQFGTRGKPQERQEPTLQKDTLVKVNYRNINPDTAQVNPNSAVRQNPNNPWNHRVFQTSEGGPVGPGGPGGSWGPGGP